MHHAAEHVPVCERGQVRARLAQLDAFALDVPDAETPADERVQVDPSRQHISAARLRGELHPALLVERAQRLLGDEGERVSGRRAAVGPVVAVAREALSGMRLYPLPRLRQLAFWADVDGDHLPHAKSLPSSAAAARGLDPDDGACAEMAGLLGRNLLPVDEVAAAAARSAALL